MTLVTQRTLHGVGQGSSTDVTVSATVVGFPFCTVFITYIKVA